MQSPRTFFGPFVLDVSGITRVRVLRAELFCTSGDPLQTVIQFYCTESAPADRRGRVTLIAASILADP